MSLNPDGFLATQDLKDRGWTPALITRYLGEHDRTRPNGLKMGRRRLPPVKLYAEARVDETERRDDFLAAQAQAADRRERTERHRAERAARRQRQIEEAARSYTPTIEPRPLRRGAVRQARDPHLPGLEVAFQHHAETIGKLSADEAEQLQAMLRQRLDEALNAVYAWYPVPGRERTPSPQEARPSDWRQWDWE
ncbi:MULTISPECIES: hypothetical protein [Deinococcus]|uniref:Uncharacterized protein n=1 Tax=Deinococcus rufus TaxID=2136097 RepID=A0ABV7ZC78_9DEIO|nr:hypothetical protein [Deinococcus sp. AB2017081]WQE93888.1 hypothetical protein U2P90_10755 [Deinococcus sp. AB2017081]